MSDRHICLDLSERGCRDFLTLVSRAADREPELLGDLMELLEAVAKGPTVSSESLMVQAAATARGKGLDAAELLRLTSLLATKLGEALDGEVQVTRVALVLHVEGRDASPSPEAS